MTSSGLYYQEILYPLQDTVLKVVESCSVPFYLTGGTALNRAYHQMRFSDDLDFFQNASESFLADVGTVVKRLEESGLTIFRDTLQVYEGYVLLFVGTTDESCRLKLDFVNDVEAHFGGNKAFAIFSNVDSLENITSNKLSALVGRSEAKDVVDLWNIWRTYGISWRDAFANAAEKEASMDVSFVADVILSLDESKYNTIKWVETIPFHDFRKEAEAMCRQMVSAQY